tara:strand:- start:5403 stop:5588 length:186 start_codon:yes stop_codon:yes gene_type:complete
MVGQNKSIETINEAAWDKLKLQIEYHLQQDPNLTDIKINYQIKVPKFGTKNYLNLSAKIND